MTEERERRDEQWTRLLNVVGDLERNVGTLPATLLSNLYAAESQPQQPTQDVDDGAPPSTTPPTPLGDGRMGWRPLRFGAGYKDKEGDSKPTVDGAEPPTDADAAAMLDPYVQLARKMSGKSDAGSKGAPSKAKDKDKGVKGPRMPLTFAGQRIWGPSLCSGGVGWR